MTRKDYVLIAAALRRALSAATWAYPPALHDAHRAAVVRIVAHELAEALATDNPRFDRAKFLAATGGDA